MTLLYATLGATLLLVVTAASGGTWGAESFPRGLPRGCTPEAQKCMEKLEARFRLPAGAGDGYGIERALIELEETDPVCAMLLRSAGL
jgi:hypothetical protein